MRPEKMGRNGKTPAPTSVGVGAAGLGVTPADSVSRYVNRYVIADARKAKMLMEYASISAQTAREAFEQGDLELAEFAWKLAGFCLGMSNHYLTRYFGGKGGER